jgi:hypothetical protein
LAGAVETPIKVSVMRAKEEGVKSGDFRSLLRGGRGSSSREPGKEQAAKHEPAQVDFRGVLKKPGNRQVISPKPSTTETDGKPDYRAQLKRSVQTNTKKYPSGALATGPDFREHLKKTDDKQPPLTPTDRSQSPSNAPFGKQMLRKSPRPHDSSSDEKQRTSSQASDEPEIRDTISRSPLPKEESPQPKEESPEPETFDGRNASMESDHNQSKEDREERSPVPTAETNGFDDDGDVKEQPEEVEKKSKKVPPPVSHKTVRAESPAVKKPVAEKTPPPKVESPPAEAEDNAPPAEPITKKKTKKVVVKKVVKKKVIKKVKAAEEVDKEEADVEKPVATAKAKEPDKPVVSKANEKDRIVPDETIKAADDSVKATETTSDSYEERARARRERRLKKDRGEAVEEQSTKTTGGDSSDYAQRSAARRKARLEEKRKQEEEAKKRREKFKQDLDSGATQ